ncbi:Band 7 protein family and Stomatin family-containing protein [Aphelenchoides besseyi]|nr:Band 7 protein family and Stomatin family-containing protein [Aphelenchoides besseyi]
MFRRSSSEKSPLVRYRTRPTAASHHHLQCNLDGSSSEEEEATERTHLMEENAPEGEQIRIEVPEFPIATAHFRRPRSGSTIGSRHGSTSGPSPYRRGRRLTLNLISYAKEEKEARRQSLAQLRLSYYPNNQPDAYDTGLGVVGWILICLSYIFMLLTFPISICFCVRVVQEYERAVIFRLGRLIGGGAKGPGIFFVVPCIEQFTRVDLRTVSFNVPPQEILTLDAVVWYRIFNATISIANVENSHLSTRLLAQTALRNILGTRSLSDILSDRDEIAAVMQNLLADTTARWGIKVERVEIKDVRLPVQLQRSMAREAESARDARAKVIASEGERLASRALREAAKIIAESPSAIQLRYLQTLNNISSEKNQTIILPLPIELLRYFTSNRTGT